MTLPMFSEKVEANIQIDVNFSNKPHIWSLNNFIFDS